MLELGRASRRETVAGWTLNNRAASAPVLSPLVTIFRTSACCRSESFGRHPPMRPSSRAASNPALVRSLSMARSNSANAPTICIIIRPAAVVVSMASVRLRNPAPESPSRSIMVSTSRRERESRSSFQTHQHIALAHLIEKPMKFRPVPASAGSLLPIDAFTTSGFERRYLGGGDLVVGGDSGVADQHCTNVSPIELVMQYLFATPKAA